jgi:hypothetical protein
MAKHLDEIYSFIDELRASAESLGALDPPVQVAWAAAAGGEIAACSEALEQLVGACSFLVASTPADRPLDGEIAEIAARVERRVGARRALEQKRAALIEQQGLAEQDIETLRRDVDLLEVVGRRADVLRALRERAAMDRGRKVANDALARRVETNREALLELTRQIAEAEARREALLRDHLGVGDAAWRALVERTRPARQTAEPARPAAQPAGATPQPSGEAP